MSASSQRDVEILILGESHSTAIANAIRKGRIENVVAVDVRNRAEGKRIDEALFEHYRPRNLILAFGGTEHNIIGLIETEPKFDFLWPPHEDFDRDRALVPAVAIEQLLESRIRTGLQRALTVRAHFDCPALALAPPPPFLSAGDDAQLPSVFTALLEAGITPGPIRRKLHAAACHVMARAYAASDIGFIDAPPAARNPDGYLPRELWNKDPTHGNAAYGRLVIDHLMEQLHV